MYKSKKISEISKTDTKISLIGVVKKSGDSFVLEDSSGKIEILTDNLRNKNLGSKKIEENKLVRVFCSIVNGKVTADAVQNLEGLDLNLFNKVKELYIRAGLNV